MIRAVFLDLDGTLLDCTGGKDRLSDYTLRVFERLKQAGIHLFTATGRSLSFLPESVGGAGFDGWVLVNGGCVWAEGKEITRPADSRGHMDEQGEKEPSQAFSEIPV